MADFAAAYTGGIFVIPVCRLYSPVTNLFRPEIFTRCFSVYGHPSCPWFLEDRRDQYCRGRFIGSLCGLYKALKVK